MTNFVVCISHDGERRDVPVVAASPQDATIMAMASAPPGSRCVWTKAVSPSEAARAKRRTLTRQAIAAVDDLVGLLGRASKLGVCARDAQDLHDDLAAIMQACEVRQAATRPDAPLTDAQRLALDAVPPSHRGRCLFALRVKCQSIALEQWGALSDALRDVPGVVEPLAVELDAMEAVKARAEADARRAARAAAEAARAQAAAAARVAARAARAAERAAALAAIGAAAKAAEAESERAAEAAVAAFMALL